MPPELIQALLALQVQGGSREMDYGLKDLPADSPFLEGPGPSPIMEGVRNMAGLDSGVKPRTMEDVYREAKALGQDPSQYDPLRQIQPGSQVGTEGMGGRSLVAPGIPTQTPVPPPRADPRDQLPGTGLERGLLNVLGPMSDALPPKDYPYELPMPPPAGIGPPPAELGDVAGLGRGGQAYEFPGPLDALQEAYGEPMARGARGLGAFLERNPLYDALEETYGGLKAGGITEANPPEYLEALHRLREENTARIAEEEARQGQIDAARASPDLTLPVSPPQGEYRLPQPPPGEPEAARMDPEEAIRMLQGGAPQVGVPTGAEVVAQEAADEADTAVTTPTPELQTGETAGDQRRAANEAKIGKLTALRSIAEGLGTTIPVKGEITTGTMPGQYKAKGIQEAIDRLSEENKLELVSGLRGEQARKTQATGLAGAKELQRTGAGYAMERVKEQEKLRQAGIKGQRIYAEAAAERREGRQLVNAKNMAEFNAKLKGTIVKPLTDSAIGRLTAMEHLEKELTGILRDKHKFNTGPVQNAVETGLSWILGEWAISPEKAGFRARLNNVLAWYVRAVEGGRPSDKDREFLKTVAPHAGDDDQSLIYKTVNLLNWAKRNKISVEKHLSQGRTLSGGSSSILKGAIAYSDLTPEQQAEGWEPDFVTVQLPGEEPDEIPRANLEAFLEANPDATAIDS